MNTYTPLAAVFAMAAVGAPLVCQAQDPAAEYKNVATLRAAKKNAEALQVVDRVLAAYGNPTSRVAQQFYHFTPFFYWQKGEILVQMGELDKAYDVFKQLSGTEAFKAPAMLQRSKELPGQKEEGYAPLLSAAKFQMGNIRYQQAVGKEGKSGDAAKFEECIPLLEEYLKLYETRKVTKKELSWKLDGKVCFLLMQSYLLKPSPDFAKAGEYMEKGRKAKAALPDDMLMSGLNTVLNVALKNPQYIAWGSKLIESNPSSFHMPAERMAPHGAALFNFGIAATKVWEEALREGDMKLAADAARTTYSLFGLVPDVAETTQALRGVTKLLGDTTARISDDKLGVTIDGARAKALTPKYEALTNEHTELEAYATLSLANVAAQMGSNRLAKAGYKVLLDRYPKMRQKKGEESTELRDLNYLQYAQFSRLTGDEETATKYENMLDPSKVGAGNKNTVVLNKMARLVREKQWEEVVPVADEVIAGMSNDVGSPNYVSAVFSKLAALYMLHRYEDVVKTGEEFLSSGMLTPGKLTEEQVRQYEPQSMFFVSDAYKELAAQDPANLDKALTAAENFMKKYPVLNAAENPMAPNVYYNAVTVLLKRRGHGDPAADKQDLEKALRYCEVIGNHWKENDLYPTARLLAGSILINGEDDSVKPNGIIALEEAADSALKQPDGKGKPIAANALFWLASYGVEYPRDGEDESALNARIDGYLDRFWKEADYEGNPYALQTVSLLLSRAENSHSAEVFDAAEQKAKEIIAREANFAFKKNIQNPDLEKTINSYVVSFVNGQKTLHNKDLTIEEKTELFTNFPGISKDDKYTNAILHMALLNSMNEAMVAAKRAGEADRASQIERDIARSFRQMRDAFKPADLTNFICVQVGNYEVDYARRLPAGSNDRKEEVNMALSYFNQVIERHRDMVKEASLGKANALALSDDDGKRKEAFDLYTQLASGTDPAVVGPALIGLTDLNMSTRNFKAAVDSAGKFVDMRGVGTGKERLSMMLKLGEAFCESGDVQKGLQTYMNLYAQNRGNITFSAPACKAIMEQLWKRNTPTSGDRLKGDFKQSDRWRAWNTGQDYVTQVKKAGIEAKMTPAERDLFNEVTILLDQYAKDPKVQQEEKEKNAFQAQLKK